MVKEDKLKLDVETRGLEEAIEQVEDLREAISTAPRVVIKNPRDCTITVDSSEYINNRSEYWNGQETEQSEPDRTRVEIEDEDLGEISRNLFKLQKACRGMECCEECPLEKICDEGGMFFDPYKWEFGK